MKAAMHPMRVAILATMGKREMAPVDVARELGVDKARLGVVAYHFRPMLAANLIRTIRTEQVRGAIKTVYKVQPNVLRRVRKQLAELLEELDTTLDGQ